MDSGVDDGCTFSFVYKTKNNFRVNRRYRLFEHLDIILGTFGKAVWIRHFSDASGRFLHQLTYFLCDEKQQLQNGTSKENEKLLMSWMSWYNFFNEKPVKLEHTYLIFVHL